MRMRFALLMYVGLSAPLLAKETPLENRGSVLLVERWAGTHCIQVIAIHLGLTGKTND